jgi:hypothetical protein
MMSSISWRRKNAGTPVVNVTSAVSVLSVKRTSLVWREQILGLTVTPQ